MSEIKVTQKEIDRLMDTAEVHCMTEFGKCTVVTVKLANGFILTESSACVDPENYNYALGKKLCMDHIESRLWELEGYALQKKVHEEETRRDVPPMALFALLMPQKGVEMVQDPENDGMIWLELAEFMEDFYCHAWTLGANDLDDDRVFLDWLKQPAEE